MASQDFFMQADMMSDLKMVIDLEGPCELIPNLRVKVRITAGITGQ